MTKHVVSNSQVAHLWANQSQDWARGFSMSFNGNYLSSYRTVIARLLPDKQFRGRPVCLIRTPFWGPTTAKHIHYAHNAIRRYHWVRNNLGSSIYVNDSQWHVFDVTRIEGEWGSRDNIPHEINVQTKYEAYVKRCESLCKPYVRWYGLGDGLDARLKAIFEAAHDYRDYAQCFMDHEPYPNFDYWVYKCRTAWAKYHDPALADARGRERIRKEMADYRTLSYFHAWQEGVYHYKEADAKAIARRLPRRLRGQAEHIIYEKYPRYYQNTGMTRDRWLKGEGNASFNDWDHHHLAPNETLLRRKGDTLQTSRGAEVPWADALRAWRVIQKVRCSGKEYIPNGLRHGVGGFLINKITAEGTMTIGCHVLHYPEMLRLAVEQAPSSVIACYPVPAPYAGNYEGLEQALDAPTMANILYPRPRGFNCGDASCSYCGDPIIDDDMGIGPGEE